MSATTMLRDTRYVLAENRLTLLRDISLSAMAEAGGQIVTLTCIAGLTGLPQINLPLAETPDGIPVGLSL